MGVLCYRVSGVAAWRHLMLDGSAGRHRHAPGRMPRR